MEWKLQWLGLLYQAWGERPNLRDVANGVDGVDKAIEGVWPGGKLSKIKDLSNFIKYVYNI